MTKEKTETLAKGLDEYPISTVIVENLFVFLWIAVGAYLCWKLVPMIGWIYLAFGLAMVLCVMRVLVCKNCYYHGKLCHTGWGKLSALYCRQGELSQFCCGFAGTIIPLFYGSMTLFPLILGTISIVKAFSLFGLCTIVVFLFIAVMSSYILRKRSCTVCRMRNMCPGSAAK